MVTSEKYLFNSAVYNQIITRKNKKHNNAVIEKTKPQGEKSTARNKRLLRAKQPLIFYLIKSFFLMKSITSSTVVNARATTVSAPP